LLQRDVRVGDLAFNRADRSLWGIRHFGGICTLVRILPPYRDWQQVFTFPYGTTVYDLDVSPDGTQAVASVGEISGQQEVRVFDIATLLRGEAAPVARFDFGTAVPNNFVFTPDGRFLFGSAYYTGVSNIFRYDIASAKLDAVTNADTGFFRPVPLNDEELIVFRYTGAGFVPTRIVAKPLGDVSAITFLGERLAAEHPVVKDWMLGSPASIPDGRMPKQTGEYRPVRGLGVESVYPILQGYKDQAAAGFRANFSDPVQLNRLFVAASYSPGATLPADERVHLQANYQRYDWRGRFDWNRADFYDLFGPTRTSRKGYTVGLGHKTTILFDEPRRVELDVDGFVAGGLDRLPDYQNVPVSVSTIVNVTTRLVSANVRTSLGGVDEEKGTRWSAALSADHVQGRVVSKMWATFDRGLALPIAHSSLWFRHAAGFSPGDRTDPFASFYFGGFGNNYVDRLDEKRYRADTSFPGLAINEMAGRNFLKSTIEWTLPPWRFRRAGTPGFYATWARPAVFVSDLATDLDASSGRRHAVNAGAQVDFRLAALSTLDLTLSVGGAIVVERAYRPRHEAMLSLKILRQ